MLPRRPRPAALAMDANSARTSRNRGRLVAIARRRQNGRDHIAVSVAKRDDAIAFHLFMPAETNVITPFFAAVVVPSTVSGGDVQFTGDLGRTEVAGGDRHAGAGDAGAGARVGRVAQQLAQVLMG